MPFPSSSDILTCLLARAHASFAVRLPHLSNLNACGTLFLSEGSYHCLPCTLSWFPCWVVRFLKAGFNSESSLFPSQRETQGTINNQFGGSIAVRVFLNFTLKSTLIYLILKPAIWVQCLRHLHAIMSVPSRSRTASSVKRD